MWINIENRFRLGGSALAQTYKQQGNDTPDIQNSQCLKHAFKVTQALLSEGKLLAGHDISDGGLIVTLLEMAFAGLSGLKINITDVIKRLERSCFETSGINDNDVPLALLFAEECGWVLRIY